MEYADRRTAELAALEAHRRNAAQAGDDPAPPFRLGVFAHGLAMQLLEEAASALRGAHARLEAQGDRGEAWERARAAEALCLVSMGKRAGAWREVESLLSERPHSPSGLAALSDLLRRDGRDDRAREILDEAAAASPEHPLIAAVRRSHS